jgi:hypothetical protein
MYVEEKDVTIQIQLEEQRTLQSITNILGLEYIESGEIMRVHIEKNKEVIWYSGEKHESGQQWWWPATDGSKIFLLPAATEEQLVQSIKQAANITHTYQTESKIAGKKEKRNKKQGPQLDRMHRDRTRPMEPQALLDILKQATQQAEIQWDWTLPPKQAVRVPEWSLYTNFIQRIGIAAFVYAQGQQLQEVVRIAKEKWRNNVKFNIDNDIEVEVHYRIGAKTRYSWLPIVRDLGRMETWLTEMPKEVSEIIREYYPRKGLGSQERVEIEIKYPSLLGNHPMAAAQHLHYDTHPFQLAIEGFSVERLLGSALAALKPSRVIFCLFLTTPEQ